jgi:copper chaperone CopZ
MLSSQFIFAQDVKNTAYVSTSFKVFGACDQCKNRIEKVLKIKGVKMVNWDVDTQILAVEFSPIQISIEKIQNKILSVGHDLVDKKAKDIIYSELPDCCHYREEGAELVHEVSMDTIKGVVLQDNTNGKFEPLANATIYWLGATAGVVSDSSGVFAALSALR